MKPNFALDLSPDGIRLFHRGTPDWRLVGEARLQEAALADQIGWLRATALALAPEGISTKLILPASEVLYVEIPAPGPDAASRRRQIRAALAGMTPYAVEDLAFDWSGEGPVVQVAVVARETLEEAEAFAADHRFAPLCFVAVPPEGRFAGEPCFAQTRVATALLPSGERVERDDRPIYAPPAHAAAPDPEAPGPQAPEPEVPPAPGPDLPGGPEPEVPDTPPQPEIPEPTPPSPDLPEPELPGRPGEVPPDAPDEVPPAGPVESPPEAPVEVPDSLPPGPEPMPPVMAGDRPAAPRRDRAAGLRRGRAPSPEAAAATLAPVEPPHRPGARRALKLTGGLVAVLLLVWLLAGLLPSKISAWFDDGAGATEVALAAAPLPGFAAPAAAAVMPAPPPRPEAAAAREAAVAPVYAIAPAARPVSEPGRPIRPAARAPGPEEALRQALAAAQAPVYRGGTPALALLESRPARPARSADMLLASLETVRPPRRPGPAAPIAASPTLRPAPTAVAALAPDRPRARPGSAPVAAAPAPAAASAEPARLSARPAPPRPASVLRMAEAESPPVASAVARPRARPRDFSAAVDAALASVAPPPPAPAVAAPAPAPVVMAAVAPVRVAPAAPAPAALPPAVAARPAAPTLGTTFTRRAVEPEAEEELESAPIAPAIPTRANVAKQATLAGAINLRKVNLIGVYGTSSNRRALVRLSNGKMQRVKVGDRLDGGQVAAIGEREIRYIKSGRALLLSLPST